MAVPQQHAHVIAALVGGDDVEVAITKVCHRHEARVGARAEGAAGLERAVAVTQQHADGVVGHVSRDDIEVAITEVRHRHRLRPRARG